MKLFFSKTSCFLLNRLIIICLFLSTASIGFSKNDNKLVDSLKTALKKSRSDTAKIGLKYWVARKTNVNRITFWDSLNKEAKFLKYGLYESLTLQRAGLNFVRIGEAGKGLAALEESIKIAENSGLKGPVISGLYSIVNCQLHLKEDINKDIELCLKGRDLSESEGNARMVNYFNLELGNIYYFIKDYKKAISQHHLALQGFKELNNCDGILESLGSLGSCYREINDTLKMISYYLDNINYIGCAKSPYSIPVAYEYIGTAYTLLNKFDSSEVYYKLALKNYSDGEAFAGMASVYNLLAYNSYRQGLYKQSIGQANEALKLARAVNFTTLIPNISLNLKNAYLKVGNYKSALEAVELYYNYQDSVSNESNRKIVLEKEFKHNLEKKESENLLLSTKNQLQVLQLDQKNYFILGLSGVLIFALVISWLLIRQNKIKQRQLRVEFTHKLLRSQINPHFMSNSLSAIQGLMLSGQIDQAAEYQARFSSYLRQVLDSTSNNYVSLFDEINSIKLYLDLERLRFENNFQIELRYEDEENAKEIMVPSFLVQPFIENAIWHGLLPLKNRKPKLSISVYVDNEHVFFEVEDNGVGRGPMAARNKRKSKGIKIVTDSIANLNQLSKINENKLEVIDLYDENNSPIGTKVIVCLKCQNPDA